MQILGLFFFLKKKKKLKNSTYMKTSYPVNNQVKITR
jgi:hypothetical protein